MRRAMRWHEWRAIPDPKPDDPDHTKKVPFYVNGAPRGATDTPEDWAQLASYQDALSVVGRYAGLAFALGPDGSGGYWQGVDFDDVAQNQLSDLANVRFGYVELSPSGNGCHVIGYGPDFQPLGSNGTGIEAYAHGRYFTVTFNTIFDGPLVDLAAWVASTLAPRHQTHAQRGQAGSSTGSVYVDPQTVTELRSALNAVPADDYHVWVRMGCALSEIEQGRELWLSWSQQSSKWKPTDAKKWDSFRADRTSYQAVFAEAQRHGWVNPRSNAAQVEPAPQEGFVIKFTKPGEIIVEIKYLIDPWLPRATVIGCYGRGEAGKSSWVAQTCAAASRQVSTLWITSEENPSHIRKRHEKCGGEPGTLAVLEAVPTKLDPKTKKPIATSINVYEHLEPAIENFLAHPERRADRPLGIVVLDAVVALVTFDKGENANADKGVKRLIAFLVKTSERYNITIEILGHLNKGTHTENIADAVTGAAAWTNSVRLAFMFAKDLESQSYEGFVRTAKTNTGTHFGAQYRTVPVHTLRERPDGRNDVLCGIAMLGPVVWGEMALREMMAGEKSDPLLERVEQARTKIQTLVDATLQVLRGVPSTTRKAVEATVLSQKFNKRHWLKADAILSSKHGVQISAVQHGELTYWLQQTNG